MIQILFIDNEERDGEKDECAKKGIEEKFILKNKQQKIDEYTLQYIFLILIYVIITFFRLSVKKVIIWLLDGNFNTRVLI